MTLDEFIKKYNGKIVCYPAGKYCGECLSLVKQYIKECFGIEPPPSGVNSAWGYWTNFPHPLPSVFEKIPNTTTGVPKKGDIIIWSKEVGSGYGHIAIFLEGNASSFRSFDSNWGGKQAHIQGHYYNNVLGWLHPKGDNMEWYKDPNTNAVYKYDPDADKYYDWNDPNTVPWNKVKNVRPPGTYLVPYSDECQKALNVCEQKKDEFIKQNGELVGDVAKLKDLLEDCETKKDECIVERDKLQKQIDEHKCEVKDLTAWEHFRLFISKILKRS